ncbi:rod shape-determining protein MreC [Verminephrobacter aporrectodeae]|uniref:rod shape-determining protein MreC n=2 Tax=Verminephrobacter aporrectodeae TaxID=1110389 RepID=UPI002237F4ED|nr:rod shape-determining protein MreC [Verminephrobacter aporrectodeae]MCW5257457.1 rod shape-determining protein MreC [Verminephrobacter aporrectodeae subsp. tuberculatae]MCW8175648.1 rod shape-determining protein MreC [Verminephrobacter aporrectodeae subsp. tuberculatae]MCW8199040.1 rod shape-determining protein MreC [Verminephrobacter aporrectodeae subsp. tuberculatae]MCW8203233.1 rod shape-determining protein MreC [Verminephrobacter aporrectodeae subsp. tuberculatae]MCW8207483.1 rod shape-
MPQGTLERNAPPFFKQGPSDLSRLALYSALTLFLMVADTRFQLAENLRQIVATVLYPVQWLMLKPVEFADHGAGYFQSLQTAQEALDAAHKKMTLMGQRAHKAEQLAQENSRLRQLLALRDRLSTPAHAAEVIYDTADPYTRRVVIDRGQMDGVQAGSPVMDEAGVLGQVKRVFPLVSEVSLLVDHDQAIPVLNVRTGARAVAYGDPVAGHGGMELRFMPASADLREADLLTTSGVDGLYPPGLPVARVLRVERQADSAFARVYCIPLAQVQGARHVLVLQPLADSGLPRPEPAAAARRGRRNK